MAALIRMIQLSYLAVHPFGVKFQAGSAPSYF